MEFTERDKLYKVKQLCRVTKTLWTKSNHVCKTHRLWFRTYDRHVWLVW